MSITILIIGLVLVGLPFISFQFSRRKPTKMGQRITYVIQVTLGIILVVLSYWASIKTEDQIQLAHDQGSEAIVRADKAQVQITEIRTPRRMEPETRRMLAARLKPFAGQKYDMKVFRDQDSLELATAIQAILEETGWVYTNVYPRYATVYAETRDDGVWLISGKVKTRRTSEARVALHGALNEAGLYDDSTALTPVSCVESTGPIQKGTKFTRIPCSESPIQSIEVDFTVHDDVIPEDTLVLHIGKERL
ncbi:MAG: hypothetical protein F4090_03260 [Nitrospira sp. SB0672_bin_25]|nr:hypothetical protein [Nitrospira sp. SB0666_bin_27]MYF24148.1 hypothetical protein [Nitrospira sp. SB0678_bin_10]MYJ53918.1 hypothetical protein [Nitrospira sp. SB0672_bin_25]